MITIRKSHERGNSHNNWLASAHTFSFGDYYDSAFKGFGHLRVLNEDRVQPGKGFNTHPHHDMEIISYVIEGLLAHKDSQGSGSIITPGEIQIMTAGTGIEHSEFNYSSDHVLHFLQIWIVPEKRGLPPSYNQIKIQQANNCFILIGSKTPQEGIITIHQEVELYAAYLTQKNSVAYLFKNNRAGWLQLIKGKVEVNGQEVSPGDGVAFQNEEKIHIDCIENAELLFFDISNPPHA